MLGVFDWLRRCETGGELIATLDYFQENEPDPAPEDKALAGPLVLGRAPCSRCWLYPGDGDAEGRRRCPICAAIVDRARRLGGQSYAASVVWGHVNRIPDHMASSARFYARDHVRIHIPDDHHFLMILDSKQLKEWIQELMIYHGGALAGLLQVFPTIGRMAGGNMGEMLCRAVHNDSRFPMDLLRVRFFPKIHYLLRPHAFENRGIVTRPAPEFLKTLEMAHIFRSLLRPDEQDILRRIVQADKKSEAQFLWGRFMGVLSPKARDMLNAWNFRQWTGPEIDLMYHLLEYVEYAA